MPLIKLATLAATLALVPAPVVAQDAVSIADATAGSLVLLTGRVERISDDDEFILADATASIPVYIGSHPMAVVPGETLTVVGRVDDDPPRELYAKELRLADGRILPVGDTYE